MSLWEVHYQERKDNHCFLKHDSDYLCLQATIIQTLTQEARSTPSVWQRKPIQQAHEKGPEVSKRPDIMRTNASGSPEENRKQQVC